MNTVSEKTKRIFEMMYRTLFLTMKDQDGNAKYPVMMKADFATTVRNNMQHKAAQINARMWDEITQRKGVYVKMFAYWYNHNGAESNDPFLNKIEEALFACLYQDHDLSNEVVRQLLQKTKNNNQLLEVV